MGTEVFDAIVIGSGQGGNPLALAMAGAGWKTAVVERGFVGGTCVNVGCTPTKALVASARVAYLAKRGADFGMDAGPVRVDMAAAIARKREIVLKSRGSGEKSLQTTPNLTLIRGEASFAGAHAISVLGADGAVRDLAAEKIFIDTGTRPAIPKIVSLGEVPYLTNESILELETLPERLIVLGGGYIALEFAQMFRRFGSEVTIVQKGAALAEREDADVSEAIAEILREDGVSVLLEAEVGGVHLDGRETVVAVEVAGMEFDVRGTHLLVATGRTPNTEDLHCERGGVALDADGYVKVNIRLETSAPGIWAIGDVKGGPAFTQISYDDYRVLKANLVDGLHGAGSRVAEPRTTAGRQVPYTIFLDPELGRIGMTEKEAREAGKRIKVSKMPMRSVARAFESGETRGFLKAVVDADSDEILGAAILGEDGGEIAAVIQAAMMGELPLPGCARGFGVIRRGPRR